MICFYFQDLMTKHEEVEKWKERQSNKKKKKDKLGRKQKK